MKEFIIAVPNTTDKVVWIKFINDCRSNNYIPFEKIIFDFNSCNFLDPGCLTMLACLIEEINLISTIEFNYINGSSFLNTHLDNIRFKEYWQAGFNRNKYTNSKNSTTLCLWHISSSMIDTYGKYAEQYYRAKFFQHKDLQPLSSTLVEIFNNIFNHADSIVDGYILTQYFPKLHKMSIAVCDFGKGIATSINEYQFRNNKLIYHPECYAIQQSLVAGVSSRSIPQNAGLGLSNVLDFSENTDGTLTIFSNSGSYVKKSKELPILNTMRVAYNGTLITLDIDTSYFEQFDEEEKVFEF